MVYEESELTMCTCGCSLTRESESKPKPYNTGLIEAILIERNYYKINSASETNYEMILSYLCNNLYIYEAWIQQGFMYTSTWFCKDCT
jgi:hypothetical protein